MVYHKFTMIHSNISSNLRWLQRVLLILSLITGPIHAFKPSSSHPPPGRHVQRHWYSHTKAATSRLFSSSSTTTESIDADVTEDCDIVIFGGGFGGLYTALAIHNLQQQQQQQKDGIQKKFNIVLVEPTEQFVFLPLLYDLTVGTATEQEVCPTYNDIFQDTNIKHIRASFESIEVLDKANEGRVITASIRPIDIGRGTNRRRTATTPTKLHMKAAIIAVGASPDSIIASVPGAKECVQPFYTANDAKQTRRLLNHLEKQQQHHSPRIAVIGGGYGGVELAASIQRRLPKAQVHLLCRGRPMANTRAEGLVDMALNKLGVTIEPCNVKSLEVAVNNHESNEATYMSPKIRIGRTKWDVPNSDVDDETRNIMVDELPWDAVLWTAGSLPADPISTNGCDCLMKSTSGRIAIDTTLRCLPLRNDDSATAVPQPKIWALGDCAEIVTSASGTKALPKTAQVAMQQADTVARNVVSHLLYEEGVAVNQIAAKEFEYQDLGSMLTLGGPNAAVLAPKDDSTFGPLFAPLLDIAGAALGVTDNVLISLGRTPIVEQLGIPTQETLGLSLGSYGLGVTEPPKGTLAGTLAGAARRTVYAVRMPTNQQRAVSLISATISTAAALIKENSDRNKK